MRSWGHAAVVAISRTAATKRNFLFTALRVLQLHQSDCADSPAKSITKREKACHSAEAGSHQCQRGSERLARGVYAASASARRHRLVSPMEFVHRSGLKSLCEKWNLMSMRSS